MAQYSQTTAMGLAGSNSFSNKPGRTREDEQRYNDANNTLSRAMGRPELFPTGLITDGAASRRGRAGNKVNMPAQANPLLPDGGKPMVFSEHDQVH